MAPASTSHMTQVISFENKKAIDAATSAHPPDEMKAGVCYLDKINFNIRAFRTEQNINQWMLLRNGLAELGR